MSVSVPYIDEYLQFAKELAKKAGRQLMRNYGNAEIIDIVDKDEKGLILKDDKSSGAYIKRNIHFKYPEHSILTEDSSRIVGNDYEWRVDSLDGSNNFWRDDPNFSVSIGLTYKGRGIVGVVYLPAFNRMYYASKDHGAYLKLPRKKPCILKVSGQESLKMFTFSFATGIDFNSPNKYDNVVNEIRESGLFNHFRRRMLESTAYELCCVAEGRFDAHFNNYAEPWDIAAGEVIVREAKGMFTYFEEKERGHQIILASNGVIHEPLVKIVNKCLGIGH